MPPKLRKKNTSSKAARRKFPSTQLPLINPPSADPLFFEKRCQGDGYVLIAGVDEAGRGSLAGPVVAAAVILDWDPSLCGIKDSKQLSPEARNHFYDLILQKARAWGVGRVEADEIDRLNILQASLKAMRLAVASLPFAPDFLLVDGRDGVPMPLPQKAIPKGDTLSFSIAAASIVAKVTRDRWMTELEKQYPQFGFSVHKGYGTRKHGWELTSFGPSPIHRLSFRGVKSDIL